MGEIPLLLLLRKHVSLSPWPCLEDNMMCLMTEGQKIMGSHYGFNVFQLIIKYKNKMQVCKKLHQNNQFQLILQIQAFYLAVTSTP